MAMKVRKGQIKETFIETSPGAVQTIQPTLDVIPLQIKPLATGLANPLDIYDNAGVLKVSVDKSGNIISVPGIVDGLGGALGFSVDGGGSVISTGAKKWIRIPFKMQISGWVLTADPLGSVVLDVLKCDYTGFPTFATIVGTTAPSLTSVQKNQGSDMTAWTTTLNTGDFIRISVTSITSITYLLLSLLVKRVI